MHRIVGIRASHNALVCLKGGHSNSFLSISWRSVGGQMRLQDLLPLCECACLGREREDNALYFEPISPCMD